MKVTITCTIALLLCLSLSPNTHGQSVMPKANWDRSLALSVVRQVDTRAVLKPLFQMVQTGRDSELLDALLSIEQDPKMPGPVKDFLIYTFAVGLGDLDADIGNPEVLHFLGTYEVKTRVSHIDHPRMNVPLYNVQAATAGVHSRWAKKRASIQAQELWEGQTAQWISAYLKANNTERMGFVDTLDFASPEQINDLGWTALKHLDERPELTLITARAGVASRDFKLLQQAILQGGGPELSRALAIISPELSDDEAVGLLSEVLYSGSAVSAKAALAIAQLAPDRLDNPEVVNILFNTLASQSLGAAAALVLGSSQDPEIQARLKEIASEKGGLSQQRARLAISTRHANRGMEQ
jgi:hypothetical protein